MHTTALALQDHHRGGQRSPRSHGLQLPAGLRAQLACLAELSYPFASWGILLGRWRGSTAVVEEITHAWSLPEVGGLDPRRPTTDALSALIAGARAIGRTVVGIWHTRPEDSPSPGEEGSAHGAPLLAAPSANDTAGRWQDLFQLEIAVSALGAVTFRPSAPGARGNGSKLGIDSSKDFSSDPGDDPITL